MRIVGILALVGSVLFCQISFATDIQGFKLQPWKDCASDIPCEIIEPKDWSYGEIEFVSNALIKFRSGGLRHILNTIQSFGYNTIERSSFWYFLRFDFEKIFAHDRTSETSAVTIESEERGTIVLTDTFFNEPVKIDPISGENHQEIILLHELAHAYDLHRVFSTSQEFLNLSGFEIDNIVPTFKKITLKEIKDANLEFDELRSNKKFLEAHNMGREIGIKNGLPRLYSLSNPSEAFADIVAFIYFDKNAENYLSSELIEYIDRTVLKGARKLY